MAHRRIWSSGRYSLPSHLDYHDENWSPRANRNEPSFDSDEDKDVDMSSPESFVSARESQPVHSAFYDNFTNSLSFENRPDIRQAKEASKSPKKRHTSAPVRVPSLPALFSVEAMSNIRQVSKSEGRTSLASSAKVFAVPIAPAPVKDTFSEVRTKSRLPENTTHESRGQRAVSYHGNSVPLIDLTVDKERQRSDVKGMISSSHDSEDEDVFASETSDKQYVTQRKFPSSARRRWHGAVMLTKKAYAPGEARELHFSDEDDNASVEEKSSNHPVAKTSRTQQPSCYASVFQFLLILFTVVISFSLYLHHNPHGLCLEGEFKSNLTELEHALEEELYGQHLAKKIVMAALRSHVNQPSKKALVLSFHGGTGVGKNFVSNLIAKHLFKWGYQSLFVHKIIVPLHFPHKSEVEHYSKQLSSWITGNVSWCSKRALFIFDEMDKIDIHLMETLRPFLNHRGRKSGVNFKGSIFLFLSNSGGKEINRFAWEHYQEGKERYEIALPKLEGILHNVADQSKEVWYREILRSGLIDHFVPFLPLERTHIKQCIRQNLREKELLVKEKVVAEIADQMTYFPPDFEVFSASGCKKVSSRVDVGMN